jgi:hypothetical protein
VQILSRVGLQTIVITGEFHDEVKARIKALWMAMFFLAFLWLLIKAMIKKQDGGSLDSRLHQIVFAERAMDRGREKSLR